MSTAAFYLPERDGSVSCFLCNYRCQIQPGRRGCCGVRENRAGELHSLVYGKVVAAAADPVEKKPLFHFIPGTSTWSIATAGCNLRCKHCQNWQLSQHPRLHYGTIPGALCSPEDVVTAARQHGCKSISYTYTEPTVYYEFARDCIICARESGLSSIFVSNGFMSRECCHDLAQNVDAINIDIKGYTEEFYKNVCGARLQPVLDNVRLLYELGVWVEVTTLIIPGKNDVPDDLARLAAFIVSVDTDIPWHVSAFHPAYQLNALESTPDGTLHVARKIGQDAGLRYVYTGNIRDSAGENTCCPRCNSELVRRRGFTVVTNRLCNGQCPDCGEVIAGIWHTPHAV